MLTHATTRTNCPQVILDLLAILFHLRLGTQRPTLRMISHTRPAVLQAAEEHKDKTDTVREKILLRTSGKDFFNASPLTLATLSDTQTAEDLMSYVQSFSSVAR